MFFFFLFGDRPRQETVDCLSRVVTSRDALNEHIRELQASRTARRVDAETPVGNEQFEYESWADEELEDVLDNGLDVLSDAQLTWLEYNPIALFELFDSINELLPSRWMVLVLADARLVCERRQNTQRLQDIDDSLESVHRPDGEDSVVAEPAGETPGLEDVEESEHSLARVVTDRESLLRHVRQLQLHQQPVTVGTWPEGKLQQVLDHGLDVLSSQRLKWLRGNPIALFELFDAINEFLPACWMDLVLNDATRLFNFGYRRDRGSEAN